MSARALALAAVLAACGERAPSAAPPGETPPEPPEPPRHAALRARGELRLARAELVKPRMESAAGALDPYLAPLFYRDPDDGDTPPFGTLVLDAEGRPAVDPARPAVYFAVDAVPLHDHEHPRLAFLWARAGPRGAPIFQGMRATLDAEGFPALIEVLSESGGARVVYVAERLERAAEEAFGSPLPGRRLAVEPDLERHPDVVVPRAFVQGPMPMGPFVYERGLDLATLHCRCRPAPVDEVLGGVEYELRPAHELAALGLTPPPWPGPPALDECLRLPDDF